MISAFCDIPGIQSQQSLEFLAGLLDPLCVYSKQGKAIYASPSFLSLLQSQLEQVHFFHYFGAVMPLPTLQQRWQNALQGEPIEFLSSIQASRETLLCSLHFNPQTELIFLTAKKIKQPSLASICLRACEKIAAMLADHPTLATVIIRPDGLVMQSNARFKDLMAIDADQSFYVEELSHPDDKLVIQELQQKLLQENLQTYTIEKQFVSRANETVWFNCSVSVLELPDAIDGWGYCFLMILEDISENKKIYDALVRTEGKWKTFVLNSLNLFIQISSQGQIVYISPAVKRILGYEAEELLDLNITELIHPDDLQDFSLAMYLWQNSQTSHQATIECRWQTCKYGWAYLKMQGQRFPLGLEIDGIAISGYDITERKRLEAALRTS